MDRIGPFVDDELLAKSGGVIGGWHRLKRWVAPIEMDLVLFGVIVVELC